MRAIHLYCIAWIMGVWLGLNHTPTALGFREIALAVACLLVSHLRKMASLRLCILIILTFLWGSAHVQNWRFNHFTQYTPRHVNFEALIVDQPDFRATYTLLTVRPQQPLGTTLAGTPSRGILQVRGPLHPRLQYGDQLQITGSLTLPQNLPGFDYRLYLERYQIHALVSYASVSLTKPVTHRSLTGLLLLLRGALERHINETLPEPESSFLSGILLGSKRTIPVSLQKQLRATGTSHIVAISGANITILLDLLLMTLPLTTLRLRFGATVTIAVFVTVLTGASASVVRGASVAILCAYVRFRGRPVTVLSILALSALGMLWFNPLLLRADSGFQLSFGAYAGILFFASPFHALLQRVPGLKHLPAILATTLTETAAATLGTAPISWAIFHQIAPLGLIVNPLILWLLPSVTALGLLLISVGWWQALGTTLSIPLFYLLHLILQTIGWFAARAPP